MKATTGGNSRPRNHNLNEFVGRLCKPSLKTDGLGNPSYVPIAQPISARALRTGSPPRPCGVLPRRGEQQNTLGRSASPLRAFSALLGSVFCARQNTPPQSEGTGGKYLTRR